jgi:predicted transcriptional regulator
MVHRGEIVEIAVRQSGMAISEVARRLQKSRRHLYNIFEDPNVSLDTILQISKIIHHDFSKEIPEMRITKVNKLLNENEEEYNKTSDVEYWKDKYLFLLEKYNELLEKTGK